MMKTAVKTVQ